MSTPEQREVAALLVRKATADLAAARTLAADPEHSDDVVGFHVQQAVEKAIKASLAAQATEVPRTHDITYLLELAEEHGIDVPISVDDAEHLTPWAVATRYDEIASDLNRTAALELARTVVDWAHVLVGLAD